MSAELATTPQQGSHMAIVREYSDTALRGIILSLSRSGSWPVRLQAAQIELTRRNKQ